MTGQGLMWAGLLVLVLLAVLVYYAAMAAERMDRMAGVIDTLNTEVARTAALVDRVIAAQANVVPAVEVQTAADALKAANDKLEPTLPPA